MPWRTLSAMIVLGAALVGCNNGTQKTGGLASTKPQQPANTAQNTQPRFPGDPGALPDKNAQQQPKPFPQQQTPTNAGFPTSPTNPSTSPFTNTNKSFTPSQPTGGNPPLGSGSPSPTPGGSLPIFPPSNPSGPVMPSTGTIPAPSDGFGTDRPLPPAPPGFGR